MTQRSEPNEKNQNSSDAQNRWWSATFEKLLKNARVKIQAGGTRKSATTCFNQRTGTTHSVSAGSLFAAVPVLSRRRRFLAVESNAFADYQRAQKKGESQHIKSRYRWFETGLRAAHVRPGPSVDSDDFALFDEERNLDRFAGFEFCRLLDIVRAIAADSFSGFNHLQLHRGG